MISTQRLLSFRVPTVLCWTLLSLLLLSCSNYARNYTPPTLKDGAIRARNLLTVAQRRTFDGIYLEAMRQKYLGNADAAFDLLDRALMINPNDADALFQQGMLLLQSVGYSDSVLRLRGERQLQLAHQLSPSNKHYREMLGNYWTQAKRYERALRLYEQVAADDPTEDNLKMLEVLQERTSNWDAALQTLDRIALLEGYSNELIAKKTKILEMQNRISEAATMLREWSETHNGDNYPRVLLANLYLRNGYLERGREIIDDIAASDAHNEWVPMLRLIYYRVKDDAVSYDKTLGAIASDTLMPIEQKVQTFREAAAWLQEGKYDKEKVFQHAVVAMNQREAGGVMGEWLVGFLQDFKFPEDRLAVPALAIFRANPNDERAIMELIRDAVRREDAEQLDTISKRGRELHPENALFYYFGTLAARNKDDAARARAILEAGVKNMSPTTDSAVASQIYYMLGDAYMDIKQQRLAFAAYDSSIVKDPDNVHALNNYAYFLTTHGIQLRRAIKLAQRATEIEPHNPSYLDTYAWALYKAGKYAEAKGVIDSMWVAFALPDQEIQPDADYYDRAGEIYFKAGAKKEALRMWKEALQLTSDRKLQRKLRAKLKKMR